MTTTTDAAEFGLHLKQGGWRLGLLVARSVVRAPGRVARETLAPKTSATEFAKIAGTTNDRVLRYLDAWELAADVGHVPHAATLNPGDEVELDVDVQPEWGSFIRRALANRRAEARDRRRARAGLPTQAEAVEALEAMPIPAREEFVELVEAELARMDLEEAAQAAATEALIADERARIEERLIREAGAQERSRAAASEAAGRTAPLSRAEAKRIDLDLDREATDLVLALRSYTRRLFDVARDRNWTSGRIERMKDVIGLAEQLTLVAGIIGDPESGHVTDEALNQLLNGR